MIRQGKRIESCFFNFAYSYSFLDCELPYIGQKFGKNIKNQFGENIKIRIIVVELQKLMLGESNLVIWPNFSLTKHLSHRV